jgi:hypothetical protein
MTRSGCAQRLAMREGRNRDEELAITTSGAQAASMSATSVILSASSSGALSWTNCARSSALPRSLVKPSRSRLAPGASPSRSSAGHARSSASRMRASAPSPGSVATTSSPRARNSAAQAPPMVPAPTHATRCTARGSGLLILMLLRCMV